MIRVAAYVHIRRSRLDVNPTGVGKHISAMVTGLAKVPDVRLQVLGAREDMEADGSLPPASVLHGLPLNVFHWKRRALEASWGLLNWPKAERWTGEVDWVYCPAEAYVATRQARLAATVHCVNWFERELPWYDHPDTRRQRRGMGVRFRRFAKSRAMAPGPGRRPLGSAPLPESVRSPCGLGSESQQTAGSASWFDRFGRTAAARTAALDPPERAGLDR